MAEAPHTPSQFDQDEEEFAVDDAFYAAMCEADLQPSESLSGARYVILYSWYA